MYTDRFKPRRSVEKRYAAAIQRIMQGLRRRLLGATSPFQMLEIIRGFARSPTMDKASREAAEAMATSLFHDGARTWREAAMRGSKGRTIYLLLQKELARRNEISTIVDRNSKLIKSMPDRIAQKVSQDMANGEFSGKRPEELVEQVLARWPQLTRAHAKLIARTETSKASTALTRARAESAGFSWYVWKTSEDARVRGSHRHMDGVLVSWSDPPSPEALIHMKNYGQYHAGDFPNCRCYPAPLIDYEDVSWPHKVYHNGRIQMMTLAKFKKLNEGGGL
ncbi:MAG TPA: phage head morphogenesis protein [Dialister sp.]|nr:phage head morphogenesis protein [Dialister sp.]